MVHPRSKPHGPWPTGVGGPCNLKNHWISPSITFCYGRLWKKFKKSKIKKWIFHFQFQGNRLDFKWFWKLHNQIPVSFTQFENHKNLGIQPTNLAVLYKNHCVKEPWSFGVGIYTSMVQMFDQEGGELFTKVNVKDLVYTSTWNTICVILKSKITRKRHWLLQSKTSSFMYQGIIRDTGLAKFEISPFWLLIKKVNRVYLSEVHLQNKQK